MCVCKHSFDIEAYMNKYAMFGAGTQSQAFVLPHIR